MPRLGTNALVAEPVRKVIRQHASADARASMMMSKSLRGPMYCRNKRSWDLLAAEMRVTYVEIEGHQIPCDGGSQR
jgi:hypothetical protein